MSDSSGPQPSGPCPSEQSRKLRLGDSWRVLEKQRSYQVMSPGHAGRQAKGQYFQTARIGGDPELLSFAACSAVSKILPFSDCHFPSWVLAITPRHSWLISSATLNQEPSTRSAKSVYLISTHISVNLVLWKNNGRRAGRLRRWPTMGQPGPGAREGNLWNHHTPACQASACHANISPPRDNCRIT